MAPIGIAVLVWSVYFTMLYGFQAYRAARPYYEKELDSKVGRIFFWI